MAFSRLFDALTFDPHADNSNNARVISPFLLFAHIKQIPVLGMDINLLYLQDKICFEYFLICFCIFWNNRVDSLSKDIATAFTIVIYYIAFYNYN